MSKEECDDFEKIQRRFDRKWEKAIKSSKPKTFRGMKVLEGFPNNIEIYAYMIAKTKTEFRGKPLNNPNEYYDAIIYKNRENRRYYFIVRDIEFSDDKKSSFKVTAAYTRSAATFERIVNDCWRFCFDLSFYYPDIDELQDQLKEQGLVK